MKYDLLFFLIVLDTRIVGNEIDLVLCVNELFLLKIQQNIQRDTKTRPIK